MQATQPTYRFQDIDVRSASTRLETFQIIDVRQPGELVDGRIAGALNVPLSDVLRDGLPSTIDCDAPVLVVCRSGGRSASAAHALANNGYARVFNLAGGMMAWGASGLPVTR